MDVHPAVEEMRIGSGWSPGLDPVAVVVVLKVVVDLMNAEVAGIQRDEVQKDVADQKIKEVAEVQKDVVVVLVPNLVVLT